MVEQTPTILGLLQQDVLWKNNLPSGLCTALQAMYPLACLNKTRFAGNIHQDDVELLKTVEESGDLLAACVDPRHVHRGP